MHSSYGRGTLPTLIEQDTNAIYADRYAVCTMQNGKLCITPRGQFAYNLPIAEDEYLVLTAGEGRDSMGNVRKEIDVN